MVNIEEVAETQWDNMEEATDAVVRSSNWRRNADGHSSTKKFGLRRGRNRCRDFNSKDVTTAHDSTREVLEFENCFWNLSEVGRLNGKEVQGIQLIVDLNPAEEVKD